jgi:molybdenum cofactor cytidylyltransferase
MSNIGAVILAAGASSRFGKPKQLIQFGGKSLLHRAVDAARAAGCSPTAVVVGSCSQAITGELQRTDAAVVPNREWQRGIGSSIRTGVQHLIQNAKDVDAIVLLVCDQPFVDDHVIKQLIVLHEKTRKPIVASSYADTLGIPALFERVCFPELLSIDDQRGAKSIILASRERVAELSFPKGKIDIDAAEDWERLCSRSR